MPFVGDDSAPPPTARKRRWQDDDRGVLTRYRPDDNTASSAQQRCSAIGSDHPYIISARRVVAPMLKRSRFGNDDDNLHGAATEAHRRRLSQPYQRQKTPQQQAQNTAPTASGIHMENSSSSSSRPVKNILAACHICHRRPTKKSDLDSFAQCEGCDERTCFVCIRQCHGRGDITSVLLEQEALSRSFHMEDADTPPSTGNANDLDDPPIQLRKHDQMEQAHGKTQSWPSCGHCSVVCSRCCVEKGPEGEVVCLGCLVGPMSHEHMAL